LQICKFAIARTPCYSKCCPFPCIFAVVIYISEPTPEYEASQTMLAKALAKSEPLPLVGKRQVSEKEWDMLQKEVTLISIVAVID